MRYYFKKGKNATEMKKIRIYAVQGEGAVTDKMCQNCFLKFHAGDFSWDDAPWLGGPDEVDGDQTETFKKNQCYPMWEIADITKISKSIKLLVK